MTTEIMEAYVDPPALRKRGREDPFEFPNGSYGTALRLIAQVAPQSQGELRMTWRPSYGRICVLDVSDMQGG